jgi:poly-beta-1,6-N-acetyl-D-glucosamine biosynthesis protein PgaD
MKATAMKTSSMKSLTDANESMIIDIRDQLPWQKRYFSNSTTLLLWGCWLLLWQPVMNQLGLLDTQSDRLVDKILHAFMSIIEHGFIAILVCAVMLWLWSHFIPAKTAKHSQVKQLSDYAKEFHVAETEIQIARQQKVVTVHHDASGHIVRIESHDVN